MGVVTQENKKHAISPKRCKIGPRLLWRTNRNLGSRIHAFDWYQNQRPWTAETSFLQWKPRDAVENIDTYRNLQPHRAVLPAIARHLVSIGGADRPLALPPGLMPLAAIHLPPLRPYDHVASINLICTIRSLQLSFSRRWTSGVSEWVVS